MPNPTRRLLTLAALLAPALARAAPVTLSSEDKTLVDKAVAYLESLTTARGRFVQIDQRGRRAPGDIYLQRPGKMRFEYDPPNDFQVLISDGYQVEKKDRRLKISNRYPLNATPLSLFLARHIRFDRGVQVTKVERGTGVFSITARDSGKAAGGQVVITFSEAPVALKEWTITESGGGTSRIQLTELRAVGSLDPNLFKVLAADPKPKAGA